MERHGFVHDMLDVKLLILYVMNRAMYPVKDQKIYELCFQDDCLSYFDLIEALPQMVKSGHLKQTEDGAYEITEKGRETSAITEDGIAYPVMQRAQAAVERFNREIRRSSFIKSEILPRNDKEYTVLLGLDDDISTLLTLELMAPSQKQARMLAKAFETKAERVYQSIMEILLEDEKKDSL